MRLSSRLGAAPARIESAFTKYVTPAPAVTRQRVPRPLRRGLQHSQGPHHPARLSVCTLASQSGPDSDAAEGAAWAMVEPSGPYKVGFVDVDVTNAATPTPGTDGSPGSDDDLPHLTGRLFYPAKHEERARWSLSGLLARYRNSRRALWLPSSAYARSLAHYPYSFTKKNFKAWLMRTAIELFTLPYALTERIDAVHGAPLADPEVPGAKFPTCVFSHGAAGNRTMYSVICTELASQGYVVFALEHHDGTAGAARAPDGSYLWFSGFGGDEGMWEKQRYRTREMVAGLDLLESLADERSPDAAPDDSARSTGMAPLLDVAAATRVVVGDSAVQLEDFAGRLDVRHMAVAGHSFGGVTAARVGGQDPRVLAAVALDPYWNCMPPECAVYRAWRTSAPLLVVSSHDWHKKHPTTGSQYGGGVGAKGLRRVLEAAGARGAPGAIFVALSESGHMSFCDIPVRLDATFVGARIARMFNKDRKATPAELKNATKGAIARFLGRAAASAQAREGALWRLGAEDAEEVRGGMMGYDVDLALHADGVAVPMGKARTSELVGSGLAEVRA